VGALTGNQQAITLAVLATWDIVYPGDVVLGYSDGFSGKPWPDTEVSPAYEHGRRNGVNDRAGIVDDEQRALAREIVASWGRK
jgi:hypothetical protein